MSTTRAPRKATAAAAGFLGCILAANYVTTEYHMLFAGTAAAMTAGTLFAGATFVLRDEIHKAAGRRAVVRLILAGAVLSLIAALLFGGGWAGLRIAAASGVAFLLSEWADLRVWEPLQDRGYIRAAIASNSVGALVDSLVFLSLAGFPILVALPGQMVGKLAITGAVVGAVWATRRATRRQVVTA